MPQPTSLFMQEVQNTFYRISQEAIDQGLLTPAERDRISLRRTRKHGNWVRHLRNLCTYIEYKQSEENHDHDTKRGSHI